MGFLGAFLFFGALHCIFTEQDPVGAKIRANRKADYSEAWGYFLAIVFVVVIWALFGVVAVCVAPLVLLCGLYIWLFCKWLYLSIPKWHKWIVKYFPTNCQIHNYFWDDDSI